MGKSALIRTAMILAASCAARAVPAGAAGQIGVNINMSAPGGTFVDLVKEGWRWNRANQELKAAEVDASGWPKVDADYVMDFRPVAEWAGQIDDPDGYRIDQSGTYKCSFEGQAAVTSGAEGRVEGMAYDAAANLSRFDFVVPGPPGPNHGFFVLKFANTKRTPQSATGSGIGRLRILRPGYGPSTATFTDEFLNALTGVNFAAIRFMDFTSANTADPAYPAIKEWADRKLRDDASQAPIPALGKGEGAAWEYVIELANRARKDAWICVPVSASDDYVRKLAGLLKDSLDPALKIYVESSNEVWNGIFGQYAYNLAQARARGIPGDDALSSSRNTARRAVELAKIFQEIFGPGSLNNRVRVVLCSHAPMLKWWVEPMLQYVKDNLGAPADYLYGISCQAYFTVAANAGEGVAKILADARANIASQIDETGGVNEAGRKQWVAKAKAWNLPGGFMVYEGGPHPPLGNLTNLANRIRAERDSGMGENLKYNYGAAFLDLGGTLAMHFTLAGSYQRYGCFGLTDDVRNPAARSAKYRAMQALLGGPNALRRRPGGGALAPYLPDPRQPVLAFRLDRAAHVRLSLYAPAGQWVATLVEGRLQPGRHRAAWEPRAGARAGLYVARLESEAGEVSRKIILLP